MSSEDTPEDIADREKIFKRFDANGDGKISAVELGEALKTLGSVTPEEIQRMMAEIDTDGDGFISFEEFTAFAQDNRGLIRDKRSYQYDAWSRPHICNGAEDGVRSHSRRHYSCTIGGGALLLPLQPPSPGIQENQNANSLSAKKLREGLVDAIGNTPLIRINSLSDATGCEILGKAEFLNPGGSVKDRVAVHIIEEAFASGKLCPGGVVTEGSAGSTAISLATVAAAYGCKCHVVIPDDAAIEKAQIIEALGAKVERVRPVSITHKDHFVNVARRRAQEANKFAAERRREVQMPSKDHEKLNGHVLEEEKQSSLFSDDCSGGFFADQFENLANFRAHYDGTGPEIWEQTGGNVDAFVAAAGTGGTVAGVSKFLKDKNPSIKCFLIDPPGSGLFNKVTRGVMYTKEEAEGKRLKNPFDTITEGIGINRLTQNFIQAELDGAFRGTDREAVEMSRFLLKKDGLFIGSSSAMNCVGAVRVAQALGPGHTIVTILCDSGMRHLSKFFNPEYLSQHGLTPSATGLEFLS